jgi:hypothetical protein
MDPIFKFIESSQEQAQEPPGERETIDIPALHAVTFTE